MIPLDLSITVFNPKSSNPGNTGNLTTVAPLIIKGAIIAPPKQKRAKCQQMQFKNVDQNLNKHTTPQPPSCQISDSWPSPAWWKIPWSIPRCSWMACKGRQSPRYLRPFRQSNKGKFPLNALICPVVWGFTLTGP